MTTEPFAKRARGAVIVTTVDFCLIAAPVVIFLFLQQTWSGAFALVALPATATLVRGLATEMRSRHVIRVLCVVVPIAVAVVAGATWPVVGLAGASGYLGFYSATLFLPFVRGYLRLFRRELRDER